MATKNTAMSKTLSKEDTEFLETVNLLKRYDRTAFNCILCHVIVFKYKEDGQSAFYGSIWHELASLSNGEYKRMIKLYRENQRENPAFYDDLEEAIGFIRSHLIGRVA